MNIEHSFGKPVAVWSEKIDQLDNLPIQMISEYNEHKDSVAPHFIYAFISDWDISSLMVANNMMIAFDMIFVGNKDHWYCNNNGNNTMVRRVFENSLEYNERSSKYLTSFQQ